MLCLGLVHFRLRFSVHAALVPVGARGKLLMFGGDEHWQDQAGRDNAPADPARIDRTALYDVNDGSFVRISSPSTDVFCAGHAFLGDGRLLVGGGTGPLFTGWPASRSEPLTVGEGLEEPFPLLRHAELEEAAIASSEARTWGQNARERSTRAWTQRSRRGGADPTARNGAVLLDGHLEFARHGVCLEHASWVIPPL